MGDKVRHSWLRALGHEDLPARIQLGDGEYRHLRTFKHDFFAATGLYDGPSGRVVLKLGRTRSFLGLPMAWLGEWAADHETDMYRLAESVPGVPRCFGRLGRTGFAHAFVEGHPLQKKERVGDDFFPRLQEMIERLHACGMAYVDLEKRENILVGADGRPWLIDFQISYPGPSLDAAIDRRRGPGTLHRLVPRRLRGYLLARLQQGDRYHLLKHRRRLRPDTLTAEELAASYHVGAAIRLHRRLSRPLTLVRRGVLKGLTGRSRSPKQDGPEFMDDHGLTLGK
jgi:hypothetical protein